MLKVATMIAALAIAGAAQAEDVTMQTPWSGAGATHSYWHVPTSVGDPVSVGLPQLGSGGIQLWFDNQYDTNANHFKSYWIGTYAGNGLMSQVQKCVYDIDSSGAYSSACTLNGEVALVTLSDYTTRKCTISGRGQNCHYVWTLSAGQILR